ncbi:MAG: hypothetical protein MZV70_58260 [Desulfobacterales bacterium]|nr:hypothetical protein [Desulfobacterales bacterium]
MNLEELKKIREKAQKDVELRQKQSRIRIVVGMGTSGIAAEGPEMSSKPSSKRLAEGTLTDVIVTARPVKRAWLLRSLLLRSMRKANHWSFTGT